MLESNSESVEGKATHTAGPWKNTKRDGWNNPEVKVFAIEPIGFERTTNHLGEAQVEANARLIVASPDLLAAAKRITSSKVSPATGGRVFLEADFQSLEDAIAKAEGRAS